MLDPSQRVAVIPRIDIGAATTEDELTHAIESHLAEGAAGVNLQHAGTPGDTSVDHVTLRLVGAAAELTEVTVAVDSVEQGEAALGAGAAGLMVSVPVDTDLRAFAAAEGSQTWMTGVTSLPLPGPPGERLILECSVSLVATLRSLLPTGRSAVGGPRVACELPPRSTRREGSLEALVTLAVVGGATVLRCCGSRADTDCEARDVRVVRRCADIAMELLLADGNPGGHTPGDGGVAL